MGSTVPVVIVAIEKYGKCSKEVWVYYQSPLQKLNSKSALAFQGRYSLVIEDDLQSIAEEIE